ncbi:hypothetical protein HYN69_10600 [Gemmobacter aquarius]|uniref:Phage tail tube protein, TTP n=1 Tax=Paragemmobacter aquarius TaxID=2169400 RepID=A0A2S0UMA1_9RHOB|nr:hypothetical protein [Gemmobacter aquarius]AWB48890.1 hypothetical protein HYN69_10600 [Gemmobacter aquarius]
MAFYSIKGSKWSIGGALAMKSADFVSGDFTSQTWVEIKEPEVMGAIGDTFAELAFDNVTDGRTKVAKGNRKAGAIELTFALDPTDPGQLALRAAFLSESDFAFKIELADKPTAGAAPKNSTRMFIAKVMACNDTTDGIGKLVATLQPNSNLVVTHASPT